jgi:hypothetical protein
MSRAVVYDTYGGPEVLDVREVPEPHAGPGEVRVRVTAAGLNPMDWIIASQPEVAAQFGLTVPAGFGYDFAGVVDEAGDGATGFAVGDRVFGGALGKAAADFVLVRTPTGASDAVFRTPDGISDEVASTLPVAGLTAAAALAAVGLRSGDTVLLGGAAGVFVGPEALATPLTFEGTRAIGATIGSGVVMVFDETADLVGALTRIARFFRDESCGQCVPCRVGTVRQEELLARLASGRAAAHGKRDDELALLTELGRVMRDASICGLGQTASSAIESALRQPAMVAL